MTAALLLPLLAACGGGDGKSSDRTGKVVWYEGVPPAAGVVTDSEGTTDLAQTASSNESTAQDAAVPTATTESAPPAATTEPVQTTSEPLVTGKLLTDDELQQYQPNELGYVPVLMYHNIVTEYGPDEEGDVLFRTVDEFIGDLQWLYDNNFYVITLEDYVTNNISAPAGKHPVVLVFDDSRPSQFYYDVAADGSKTLDPNSAIAILEEFFNTHPGFGRTAVFAVLPIHCFDYEEPSQTPFCQEKLQWLVNNGYEVANHTWDHQDLGDVSNEVFLEKVGDTTLWIREQTGVETASTALILPYGVFPGGENWEQQWDWIRHGFDYEGQHIQLMTVLAAGADPAPSPMNVNFDVMSIARIGAKDGPLPGEADLFLTFWFGVFAANPENLYTSDGNPGTVVFPSWAADQLDAEKAAAEGMQVIEY
ncbi:MAG: polysaccharide deacetylase family protein [Thermomicrobiales bacterium]|nr:polysaccharide deacetylase family protein [Thermomicrobiales bacterium]